MGFAIQNIVMLTSYLSIPLAFASMSGDDKTRGAGTESNSFGWC